MKVQPLVRRGVRVRDLSNANRGFGTICSDNNETDASVEWDKPYAAVEFVYLTDLEVAQ